MSGWFKRHCEKLLAISDTPQSVALGEAIGLFFGFTPLFGVKTLLALLFAFLFRANKIAALAVVTLHDVALPFMPLLYRLEYDVGYWLLSEPHHLPPDLNQHQLFVHTWLGWTSLVTVGIPLLLGSVILCIPASLLAFFLIKIAVEAKQNQE